MVHLVLDADRQHAVGIEGLQLPLGIQRAHAHGGGALHAVVDAGHRQAPLVAAHALGAGLDDLGIDEHQRAAAVLRHVDDDQALVHVDLRRRQADAVGLVHGFEHVVHELPDACIDRLHRAGDRVQARVWVTENGSNGHEATLSVAIFATFRPRGACAPPYLVAGTWAWTDNRR